jgi:D-aminoacyl-tRNA deacylase
MKAVIQRVTQAQVSVNHQTVGQINNGLVVLLGIETTDTTDDLQWLTDKIINLRIFDDANQVPNLSLLQTGHELLLVSQFTLHASTKKGNRPSYINAAPPNVAQPMYQLAITTLQQKLSKPIATGVFGANMQVSLTNNGPLTIIIDTKNKY